MKSDHSRFKRKWGERKWRKLEKFLREGGQKNNEGKNSIDKKLCSVFLFFYFKMGETKPACFPVGMTQERRDLTAGGGS